MMITEKLVLLVLLNIGFLIILLSRLINAGNSYLKSLEVAWSILIFNIKPKTLKNAENTLHWFSLLQKFWWFMIYGSLIIWLIESNKLSSMVLITLLIIHIVWYFCCRVKINVEYDHIINLDTNWGIIFEEIKKESWFGSKTLAELDLRKKNLLVLAIIRQKQVIPFPKGLESLSTGDRIVIFGDLNYFQSLDSRA